LATAQPKARRISEIFAPAIRRNVTAIIVIHNHPSGDPTPSPDDVAVTRAILQAGKLLDIDVLDHMVIGQGRWVSLKERGLGFSG
jgi:DNA repair protein RadC